MILLFFGENFPNDTSNKTNSELSKQTFIVRSQTKVVDTVLILVVLVHVPASKYQRFVPV